MTQKPSATTARIDAPPAGPGTPAGKPTPSPFGAAGDPVRSCAGPSIYGVVNFALLYGGRLLAGSEPAQAYGGIPPIGPDWS